MRGWELLLVVDVEHRGGFKIVVWAVFHLEFFCKRGLLFLLFFAIPQTLQVPSTESENITGQIYILFSDFQGFEVNFLLKIGGGNVLIVNML